MFIGTAPKIDNRNRLLRGSAIGALLIATLTANASCAQIGNTVDAVRDKVSTTSTADMSCNERYDPAKADDSIAAQAAARVNRTAACAYSENGVNHSALDILRRAAKKAWKTSEHGNPSATRIISDQYNTDFGLSDADTPAEARDALEQGKRFRNLTDIILPEDRFSIPSGSVIIGVDAEGELDISISLGTIPLSSKGENDGQTRVVNSDGVNPINDVYSRGETYVLAPIGSSKPVKQ